jgi:hypothetical protein
MQYSAAVVGPASRCSEAHARVLFRGALPRRETPRGSLWPPSKRAASGCRTLLVSLFLAVGLQGCDLECNFKVFPPGTEFQVQVIEELPGSSMCHRFRLEPGQSFTLVAGQSTTNHDGCEMTAAAGPPAGVEAEFTTSNCRKVGQLGTQCTATYAACPEQSRETSVRFILQADLRTLPAFGTFGVQEGSPCAALRHCYDQFRVRVDRVPQ